MTRVMDHMSVSALEQRLKDCADVTSARHVQVIWLLAQGHSSAQVSMLTAFSQRWIQQVLECYNAEGPDTLGDLRRRNGRSATIPTPVVLDALRTRLAEPPPDGGVWSSRKVSTDLAEQLDVETVSVQRGWEALQAIGWSLQRPRPKNPRSASVEEDAAFKKTRRHLRRRNRRSPRHPGRDLRHRRAPHRLETSDAERLGSERRATCRVRPPSLQVALCHRLRCAGDRRHRMVSVQRGFQKLLLAFAKDVGAGPRNASFSCSTTQAGTRFPTSPCQKE